MTDFRETDISVIIVTYNTVDLIEACINSVMSSQGVTCEIFVVDNASRDQGVALVREKFPLVQVIANSDNRGFGAANNQALALCRGEYVVFLNPDTEVKMDSLALMYQYMQQHPEIGLAGPQVVNSDGSKQDSVSYRYPGHRYGASDLGALPGEIACVLGACQIASRSLLSQIGGFDEDFFLYGEDQDICLRIRKLGLSIGEITQAVILHHGGKSERDTLPAEVVRKKVKAEQLFYRKHYQPMTIKRILRKQLMRATQRIVMLRMTGVFTGVNHLKLVRYQVICEETQAALAKMN